MSGKLRQLKERYINRETVSYVIIGVLTTLLDWAVFGLLYKKLGMSELIANVISTAAAILFAFVTNKFIVFRSMERDAATLLREFLRFVASRLVTFALQELLLFITVTKMGMDGMIMKMVTSVIVIVLNYVFSKLFIFNKKETPMKNKRPFSEKLPLLAAFVLPIVIMLGIFAGKSIWPFGDNCFLRTDLYHQYIAFFEDLGDRLRNGRSLLYAFDIGLGSNYTALFAYYLCAPLHLFAFLIPTEYMIEFITGLIVLKIGMCGWAMAWYLSKRFKTRHWAIALCGVCYALSGYLAAYSWNIMWLDVLWLSIFAIYGLELLIKEGKPFLYCIALALSTLCNYYISIMLCLFMVLYFINRLIALPGNRGKKLLGRIALFGIYSLVAGMIAAVLVVPCAYALMGTASANTTFPKTISNYFSIIDMLARHLVVVDVEIGLDHWPNIYSGVLVFLLVPLYYMNKRVSFREKIANTMLIGFMLLSFNTNTLNYIWHGFHYPNSLPCRQSYLYTFIIMVMCFEGARELERINKTTLIRILWGAVAAILVVEVITDSAEIPYYACYASIAFLGLYVLFSYLHKTGRMEKGSALALGVCLLIIEMGLNTAVTSVSYVRRSDFMRYNDSIDELVAIAEEGKTFTRIERQYIRTKNDGVYFGYNSASIFSSTTHAAISDFYKKVGLEGNTNAYAITGATPFMWSFLGIEYKLTETRLPNSPIYEYVAYAEDRKGGYNYLYHNLYTLPLGYLVPSDTDLLWTPTTGNPFRSQNSYANIAANVGNIFDTVKASVSGATMTATATKAGHYYAYVGSSVKKATASINGQNPKVWDSLNRNYLVDFGYVEVGDELKLVGSDVSSMNVTLCRLNTENFIEAVETLKEHPFVIESWTDETFKMEIKGSVDADKASHLVFSIPIDKSWHITVDGEEAEMAPLADAFIGVMVSPGHHEIILNYVPQGLGTGIVLCLGGLGILLLSLALYLILHGRKKAREDEPLPEIKLTDPEAEEALLPENTSEPAEEAALPQAEVPETEVPEEPLSSTEGTAKQGASTVRDRISALHRFDEEERSRDKGKYPGILFENGTVNPRFISPAERQKDEKVLSLNDETHPASSGNEDPADPAETV